MVEKLSRHIALWLIKSGILENDDIDLYIYAIQYLLLIINSISAITSTENMCNDGLMREESHAIPISIMAEKIRHAVED